MRKAMMLAVVAVGVSVLGCGKEPEAPPEFPKLETGAEVMVYDRTEGRAIMGDIPKGTGLAGGLVDVANISVGTKVRVIEDADGARMESSGLRRVRVLPLEGEREGLPGTIIRKNLRPIAK
jgi:hypothetical protein